jgi:phytoene/squalene synthetase
MSIELYHQVCAEASKNITHAYSTSFSLGIKLLNNRYHRGIYGIYGFVRFADEIVDTFHGHDKEELLNAFENDTWQAIQKGISLNPVLHAFQWTVNTYGIEKDLIETFLASMKMDLRGHTYTRESYKTYILGSAEVVGLMCLRVFCEGNTALYDSLREPAMKLGSAFQKINFLRDFKADSQELGRLYFPELNTASFSDETKAQIEADIATDFHDGYQGILNLPKGSRLGVYLAYVYYYALFKKITSLPASTISSERIRIPDHKKYRLMLTAGIRHAFNQL